MTEMFSKGCAILSAHDMNKIEVGALAISGHHQIQRFFHTNNSPDIPDHDFLIPGYLIIPSGYMRFIRNSSQDSSIVNGKDITQYRIMGSTMSMKCPSACHSNERTTLCVLPTPIVLSLASTTMVTATVSRYCCLDTSTHYKSQENTSRCNSGNQH